MDLTRFLKPEQPQTQLYNIKNVRKRDGSIEEFDGSKLMGWASWACKGKEDLYSRLVKMVLRTEAREYIYTDELQDMLISAADSLIVSEPEYDDVAKQLLLAKMRKQVFQSDRFQPPGLRQWSDYLAEAGAWQKITWFTDSEWDQLEEAIDHSRDEDFTYGGLKQFFDKYARRNVELEEIYETPQFMYMGMAMAMGQTDDWSIEQIIALYDAFSTFKINVPTPPMIGLRSGDNGFASCCLVEAGDTLDSLDASEHVVFKMVAARAGIGHKLTTRSVADPVRNGSFYHMGKIPYLRHAFASCASNTQQSRGGSMNTNIAMFDPEVMSILSGKSQRSDAESRLDKIDYTLQVNGFLLERALKKQDITLMSYLYAPEVYEAFYSKDLSTFVKAYEAAEKRLSTKTRRTRDGHSVPLCPTISAMEVLNHALKIRMEVGRVYLQFVDNTNAHSNFDEPITMTNLCVEINQPTYWFDHIMDLYNTNEDIKPGEQGEVSLCNLAGITLGKVRTLEEWESVCYLVLKFVDTIIDIQDYAFPQMAITAKKRRNVGIGVMNAAGAMAELGLQYVGEEARNWLHREMEKHAYFLHKASVRLAKERGAADWFKYTLPAKGVLVIDTYKKTVDELVSVGLELDWESLRADILKYGMRNSVLSAQMPGESSSVVTGSTNSLDPIRALVTVKGSGTSKVKCVAPGATDITISKNYITAFNVPKEEWVKFNAVAQKFFNQAMSFNEYYRFSDYPDGKIPMAAVLKNVLLAYKYGLKSIYYAWFDDDNGGSVHQQGCSSGGCSI